MTRTKGTDVTRSPRALATAACGLALGLATAGAHAQTTIQTTTYTAPSGYFDVQVPAGWTTEWDKSIDQVTLRHGSTQALIQVLPLPHETSAFAAEMLDRTKKVFFTQCKTSEELQHGQAHIAGMPAASFLLRCPNAPPSVAGTAVAWIEKNERKILVTYTVIDQIRLYGDDVATLDAIGQSIHPTGLPAVAAKAPTGDERVEQLGRACSAGSFDQSECAARIAQARSHAEPDPADTSGPRFHDADSIFSVEIPAGWQASLKENGSIRGIQLRKGDNWINLMVAPASATSARNVVMNFEAGLSKDGSVKPPIGKLGIIQIFGQGLERDYDRFNTNTASGKSVETTVAGIATDTGGGQRVLMFSSIAPGADDPALKVALSVRMGK